MSGELRGKENEISGAPNLLFYQLLFGWLVRLKDYSNYEKSPLKEKNVNLECDGSSVFKLIDLTESDDDFTFTGKIQYGLPIGRGILTLFHSPQTLLRHPKVIVHRIDGYWINGQLEGKARIKFLNGHQIYGSFKRGILEGRKIIEIDEKGNIEFVGQYWNGRRNYRKPFWLFEPIFGTALLKSSFHSQYLIDIRDQNRIMALSGGKFEKGFYNTTIEKGNIKSKKVLYKALVTKSFINNDDFLVVDFDELRIENPRTFHHFSPSPNFKNPEEVRLAQSAWFVLHNDHQNYNSHKIKKDFFHIITEDYDQKCRNFTTWPPNKNEMNENERWLVSYPESGSELLMSLLMCKKSEKDIGEYIYDHGDLLSRLLRIASFRGKGLLLIRSPVDVILSRWKTKKDNHKDFKEWAQRELDIWSQLYSDWLSVGTDLIVVHFKNLFSNDAQQKLKETLRVPNHECSTQHTPLIENYNDANQIDPQLLLKFNQAYEQIQNMLKARHLSLMPSLKSSSSSSSSLNSSGKKV